MTRILSFLLTLFVFGIIYRLDFGSSVAGDQTVTEGAGIPLVNLALSPAEKTWLQNHPTIRIAGPRSFPPFHYFEKNGDLKGISADYIFAIMTQLGMKVEVQKDLPWPEVLRRVQAGEIELISCSAKTDEREAYLNFSVPYLSFPLVIIGKIDGPFIGGIEDLRSKKVAIVRNISTAEWLKRDGVDFIPYYVESPLEGLESVSLGRADVQIENLAAATYLIQKHGLTNLKIAAPTPYGNYNLHIAVRKDLPELLNIINKAVAAFSAEQHLRIRNKWLSVRYEHGIRQSDIIKWVLTVIVFSAGILTVVLIWNRKLKKESVERRHAEEALRESEERLRAIMDATPFPIAVADPLGNDILFWSRSALTLFGHTAPTASEWYRIAYPDPVYRQEVMDRWNVLLKRAREAGQAINTGEYRISCNDGSIRICELYVSCLPGFLMVTFNDITERKKAEAEKRGLVERLQRAEKMEALGTLAGGVAHDLNNVLGVVIGYAELLLNDVDASSPSRRGLEYIMGGGKKAAAIVQDLLTLARRGVPGRSVLNLNKIIVTNLNSPEFEHLTFHHSGVRIRTYLEPDLLNISGSAVHLGKSLFNLVSNGAEAMPKGGTLTIKTANEYLDKPVEGYDEIREGDYVVLSVSDTGEGIHPSDLKRIFEPFYTKKVMGRSGTGLGLAVVWGTVKDHHGYINVHSEEGKGSTLTLYFPVTREEETTDAVSTPRSEYMGNGEKILVVDDVREQRNLATTMLRKLQYVVESVSSGEEALSYLEVHPVDLMVLDMIMDPGMDGLDTYRGALRLHPKQKAIIVSGFSESDRVSAAQALGAGAYVRKPYVMEKLGLAVRKEIERSL